MDLALTVVDAATGSAADLRVTAPDASPAAPVLAALRVAAGVAPQAALTTAGRRLPGDGSVADCGLVAGAVVVAGPLPGPGPIPSVSLATTAGPDAGRRHALVDGHHRLGRLDDSAIRIPDRSISRRHLALDLAGESLTVTHLGGSTTTLLDGDPLVPHEARPVAIGSVLRLGDTELRVDPATPPPDRGSTVVHRSPRLVPASPDVEIAVPPAPVPAARARPSVIAAITPLVGGLVLSLVLHQWQFLMFTALSPVMMLGQAASDRLSARRADRVARRDHAVATAAAHRRVAAAVAAERQRRHDQAPSLADVVECALRRRPALWQRSLADADALTVRLGLGDLPADVRVVGGGAPPRVSDVPVCLRLPDVGVLGICGPPALRSALARSIVLQSAVQIGPADLRIIGVAPQRAADWGWLRWLPHTRSSDATCRATLGLDDDQAARRMTELAGAGPDHRAVLLVIDGTDQLRGLPATQRLLATRPPGHTVIWCAAHPRDLPAECGAVISLGDGPRLRLQLTGPASTTAADVVPDLLAGDVAEAAARRLSPVRAAVRADAHALPRSVRWADLSGLDLRDHESATRSLLRSWQRPPSTAVPLGADGHTAVTIDLCADGPHALVAGTTGSGKSELLVGLIAGLVARHRPDQLGLLLIDQKGGAALGPCRRLPHAVGLVTDLDGPSTRRALLCLGSELRRRESVLAATGAANLADYLRQPVPEPIGRLVIVVDEFAALAQAHPDFIAGLVGIAQRGRSLGVHLVLATQRPEGVVSADIRANTRLRICLGVAREQESRDVIDSAAAASISRTTPGRAYLRVGPGDLQAFQAARVTTPRTTGSSVVVVREPVQTLGDRPPVAAPEEAAEADLDVLVDAALAASEELGCTAAAAPWLPTLPADLPLSALPRPAAQCEVAWGMVDLADRGEQPPLTAEPLTAQTWLLAGAPRSGRTTAALTWATALAAAAPPQQLQMWAIDGGSGLAALGTLPHCGGVVPAHDPDRMTELIGFLSDEVRRRRARPATNGPALVLVVDSWDDLVSQQDDRDATTVADDLARLMADGPAAGLHVMLTGDRGVLAGRIGGLATQRLVLRLTDVTDYLLIGLAPRDVPRGLPPGRGFRGDDGALVQIATPDAAAAARAREWPEPHERVKQFAALPARIPWPSLRAARPLRGHEVILGLAADGVSPVVVDRAQIGGPFLVVGPPASGRSTALLLLARQCGPTAAICCSDRSPLTAAPGAVVLPAHDPEHAADLLEALCAGPHEPTAVLVDDADLLPEGRLSTAVERLVAGTRRGGPVIALAAATDTAAVAFRGPLRLARQAKTGLLLCPDGSHDGDVLGLRLPRRHRRADPPGRGWLVVAGSGRRVQLADAAEESLQPSTQFELSTLGARNRE